MQKLIYVPPMGDISRPETCAELSLASPYIIGSVTGTGGPEVTVLSSTVPGVDGAFVQGIRQETRQVKCFVHVKGENRADMYAKRFALAKLLAPTPEPGYLYYINDFTVQRIKAIPTSSPDFTDRIHDYSRAEITFYCPSPHWEDPEEKSGYMAWLDEGFTFPFEFNIQFASLANKADIINNGSVAAPVEITITGPATNPTIRNNTTGEYIRLSTILREDEILTIYTQRGAKRVTITRKGGGAEDAYHYIDPTSTFWQLQPGRNALEYQSDDESELTQVEIRYHELYTGV